MFGGRNLRIRNESNCRKNASNHLESKLIKYVQNGVQSYPRLDKQAIAEFVKTIQDHPVQNGIPFQQMGRKVQIFQKSRCSMQSGLDSSYQWYVEFEQIPRWKNPLMGWTSGGDPFTKQRPTFETLEGALTYCVQSGFEYDIKEPSAVTIDTKSYSDNFVAQNYKKESIPDPFL